MTKKEEWHDTVEGAMKAGEKEETLVGKSKEKPLSEKFDEIKELLAKECEAHLWWAVATIEKDVAEAVKKLKEDIKIKYKDHDRAEFRLGLNWAYNKIDKIFGRFNHSPRETNSKKIKSVKPEGNHAQEKKGCGKPFGSSFSEVTICRKDGLCPECEVGK